MGLMIVVYFFKQQHTAYVQNQEATDSPRHIAVYESCYMTAVTIASDNW